ncbi:hypothetical protein FNO01nite_20020 [Flavobacterium noncentrifugens]|uniref:Receptor L domain-containing protein n=1 Tax=Flavobacterium noncentrifugens TaxID=1128970 RepID=A0A1G8YTH6_9FLAO|nr:hypothetical protein [Flavobacterium noncentrifugens]GEP51330.1 hypothetical protein FNO01nite_20020 [Flavobacterium noncentrifugens]SDK05310.1 hypothetical protein SAMN04487935_2445 [Flavobacterium noncentrifugens]
MKKIFKLALVLMFFAFANAFAQAPQKMSYQAVVRNASGSLVANVPVGVRISILSGSVSGAVVYAETHLVTTNVNGLMSIEIGGGSPQTGAFNAINWANAPFFVKTETDPNGGSNYSIAGTSELLSVPFALYAENSKPQGKSTIYLTGDITDTQARERLSKEFGPNTENIYVLNTTELTTLDLSTIDNLLTLKVINNGALNTLNLGQLKFVYKDIEISGNASLNTLNFDALQKVYDTTILMNNGSLQHLTFPSLKTSSTISIRTNNSLQSVSMPVYEQAVYGLASGNGTVSISYNASLVFIEMPVVRDIGNFDILGSPNLVTLSLQAFKNCGSFRISDTGLQNLNLPEFEISGQLSIDSNSVLTLINFPKFKSVSSFFIVGNISLTNLSIPLYTGYLNTVNNIDVYGNLFPSSQVNYLLDKMLHLQVTSGNRLSITQSTPAPPTGQGIIDKQTLINNGNTIWTD